MKLTVSIVALLIAFGCNYSFSAENIVIETKNDNFFENLVSDTLLLLDPDLKKIIADDFEHVVTNSKFQLQVNSWKPRQNPRIRLTNIYNDINNNNIKESFASLVQPVVEIACSPQKYDPLSEVSSKCIKEMFTYPIIQPIEIKYTYQSGKTKEQFIADLAGLNNSNRYQQMVRTTADIMNSAFEKVRQKSVAKSVNVIKYSLPIFAQLASDSSSSSSSSGCNKPSMGIGRNKDTDFKVAMEEYNHCLDMEKIKAGASLGDIKQGRQADEMKKLSSQMQGQQAEMEFQQAEIQRQQAEMQRMQNQQNFNNIWKRGW